MFATYEPFKFPVQFDADSTIWRGVEIMLNTPWLLATLEDEAGMSLRTFLLKGTDELQQFAEGSTLGRLTSVRLVLPPDLSPKGDWAFVPVRRVERELRSVDGAAPSVVLADADGRRYGGFPIGPTERTPADVALIVEFPQSSLP